MTERSCLVFACLLMCVLRRRLWDATTGQCLKTIEDEQAAPMYVQPSSFSLISVLTLSLAVLACLSLPFPRLVCHFISTSARVARVYVYPLSVLPIAMSTYRPSLYSALPPAAQLSSPIHTKRPIHTLRLPLIDHPALGLPAGARHQDVHGTQGDEVWVWGCCDGCEFREG